MSINTLHKGDDDDDADDDNNNLFSICTSSFPTWTPSPSQTRGRATLCCHGPTYYGRWYTSFIIIIIIIIIIISFTQGIYAHIPEINYVPREYGVAAILLLLFMVLISLVSVLNLLYFYISTFQSMCAVPNMAVYCISLTSWFPGMLLTYFLNDFEIVPVAPISTGITFVFTFHMRCISIVRSLYFRIFSAYF